MVTIHQIENKEQYDSLINSPDGCVLKISAEWCQPCKILTRTIENLDVEKVGKVFFAELDADAEFADDITSQLRVRGIPVLIYFKNGEEIHRTVGAVGSQEIYNGLEKLNV